MKREIIFVVVITFLVCNLNLFSALEAGEQENRISAVKDMMKAGLYSQLEQTEIETLEKIKFKEFLKDYLSFLDPYRSLYNSLSSRWEITFCGEAKNVECHAHGQLWRAGAGGIISLAPLSIFFYIFGIITLTVLPYILIGSVAINLLPFPRLSWYISWPFTSLAVWTYNGGCGVTEIYTKDGKLLLSNKTQIGMLFKGLGRVSIWESKSDARSFDLDVSNTYLILLEENESKSISSDNIIEHSISLNDELTPHTPISINGNDDFSPENGVTRGNGTSNDPYIIENWDINASLDIGIKIENTDAYFVIRNCYIHDGKENSHSGISLGTVKNGRIENVRSTNNHWYGILIHDSSNIQLDNCICTKNSKGIRIFQSFDISISNSTTEDNEDAGLELVSSSYNHLTKHKSIHNLYGIRLYQSSNNFITDSSYLGNSFYGINLWVCSGNQIQNVTCEGNDVALESISTIGNVIRESNFRNNRWGLEFYFSLDKVDHNNIYNNTYAGLTSTYAFTNAKNNWWGSLNGPSGKAPGDGDKVWWTAGYVLYRPWLISPVG